MTPPVAPPPVASAGPAPADSVADLSAAAQPAPPAGAGVTVDGIPKLTRRRDFRVLGGVAGGIADHLHVRVLWVRVAFVLLGLMSGAGVLAYGLLWIFVPRPPRARPPRNRPARWNDGRPWASPRSEWPS